MRPNGHQFIITCGTVVTDFACMLWSGYSGAWTTMSQAKPTSVQDKYGLVQFIGNKLMSGLWAKGHVQRSLVVNDREASLSEYVTGQNIAFIMVMNWSCHRVWHDL